MTNAATYELIEPEELDVDSLGPLTNLLTYGIVNPLGPTLTVVAVESQPSEADRSVVEIVLHPFQMGARAIARFRWSPDQDLSTNLPELFGWLQQQSSCPTLLISSALIEAWRVEEVWARFLAGFSDARAVFENVFRSPGDPWRRVEREMEDADPSRPRVPLPWLTASEARSLVRLQLESSNASAEFEAFLYAWNGAIDFQRRSGPTAFAISAMPRDSLLRWLTRLSGALFPGVTPGEVGTLADLSQPELH